MTDRSNNKSESNSRDPIQVAMDIIADMEVVSCAPEQLHLTTRLKRAIEHLYEHSERAYVVTRCAIELVEADSPMEVLSATLQEAIAITHAERGHILMWNEEKQQLEDARVETGEAESPSGEELAICHTLAMKAFQSGEVLINPDVQEDPEMCDVESVRQYRIRSVLIAPLIAETNKGQQKLGVVYLDTRASTHVFVDDDAKLMKSFAALAAISIAHTRAVRSLRNAYRETVNALVRALEAKDKYTKGHSERVARYSVWCGEEMGLTKDRLTMLESAALLHDIGKIGIRESVLFKPGRLTDEEYEHIKFHADLSEDIVRGLSYLEEELAILGASQEHYDGTGYPRGTKGDEIPIESYIIQVADAWDAMTSTRVYRIALTKEQASAELNKFAGSQFHPKVVDAFLKVIEKNGLIPID